MKTAIAIAAPVGIVAGAQPADFTPAQGQMRQNHLTF